MQYAYKYDAYANKDKPWFKSYDLEEWESVSEDEFKEEVTYIEDLLGIEMISIKNF